MSPKNLSELAKDVAAFANALGGSLIIGTNKDGAALLCYPGVSREHADSLVKALVSVHDSYLSPRPIAEPQIFAADEPGNVILIVNVWPYPDQPVGAKTYDGNAWRFPVRVGDQTRYLEPAMLPMLTNARVRRTVIFLESIATGDDGKIVQVFWRHPGNKTKAAPSSLILRVAAIEPEANRIILETMQPAPSPEPRAIVPIDDIEAVWQCAEAAWAIRVAGHFEWPFYHSNPSSYAGY